MPINYYQGETIGFYIEGDNVINLETNDFKVLFYNSQARTSRFELLKTEFVYISANKYYAEIPNTTTDTLQRGSYIMEVLYGSTYTSISKENTFNLIDTEI